VENSKEECPYCGGSLERGAIASNHPLWWLVNPKKTRWSLKAEIKERLGGFWSVRYRYGSKCHQCNLLIIDLVDPQVVEGRK